MMRYCLAFVLCIVWAPAWAQQVIARTGDHPTFTRIVLSMPAGTFWEMSRVKNGYRLRVDETKQLNTDLFFERIQRDRIAAVRPGLSQSEILIDLACDCFAEAFQWRSDQVVIDVRDPGSPTTSDALPIPDARADPTRVVEDLPPPPLPEPTTRIEPSLLFPLVLSQDERPSERQASVDPLGQLLAQQAQVGTLEAAISESLGRALSQGLLEPGQEEVIPVLEPPQDEDLASLLSDLESVLTPGVIARTSVDRAMRLEPAQNVNNSTVTCIPNTHVDVSNWVTNTPFATRVGNLRTEITGEFDKTDPAAIEELARTYITYGFGREAINTLSIDGTKSQSRQVLRTLGEIIDDDPLSIDDFNLQIGCPGHVALWAMLAHHDGPLAAQPNITEIITSFKLLPKPLRQHLAPRLGKRLNQLGYQDFAADVLSIGDSQAIEVATVETEILIDNGATAEAASRLSELADDDPRMTPDALITLIDLELEAEKPIGANELTLLRTFQFEVQDESLRQKLYATEVAVLIAMGSFEAAQDLIGSRQANLPAEMIEMYRTDIFDRLVRNANNAEFLDAAFDPSQDISNTSSQNAFATRLLDLGFPERAQDLISGQAVGEDMMERRYLRAEAALDMGNTERARAHLAGINSPRAQELLNAEAQEGRVASALSPASVEDGSAELDQLLSSVSNRLRESTVFQADTQTPLTDGRSLLDQSTDLRADMAELLERYQINP